jgi:hypothetical protein
MPSLGGIKKRIVGLKPHVQSAFIVYVTPRKSPAADRVDDEFQVVEVTSPDDPLLDRISAKWQRPWAREQLAAGTLTIIVATKDGEPIGRIWESVALAHPSLFSGVPRVKLAKDEFFMFDLFVEREYRRSNIGMTMADYFFQRYDPEKPGNDAKYGYGFISYENGPSILWHHSIGFNVVQTINYLSIGDRIKWRIPFSDVPRFGPMSRKGRHTDPETELFGTGLLPNL